MRFKINYLGIICMKWHSHPSDLVDCAGSFLTNQLISSIIVLQNVFCLATAGENARLKYHTSQSRRNTGRKGVEREGRISICLVSKSCLLLPPLSQILIKRVTSIVIHLKVPMKIMQLDTNRLMPLHVTSLSQRDAMLLTSDKQLITRQYLDSTLQGFSIVKAIST